jgi:hypothetical protein
MLLRLLDLQQDEQRFQEVSSEHLGRIVSTMVSTKAAVVDPEAVLVASKEAGSSALSPSPDKLSLRTPNHKASKSVRRKVDNRLLAYYSVVYLFMRINVTNVTNTAIMVSPSSQSTKRHHAIFLEQYWTACRIPQTAES